MKWGLFVNGIRINAVNPVAILYFPTEALAWRYVEEHWQLAKTLKPDDKIEVKIVE